jgi:hypothetical protein
LILEVTPKGISSQVDDYLQEGTRHHSHAAKLRTQHSNIQTPPRSPEKIFFFIQNVLELFVYQPSIPSSKAPTAQPGEKEVYLPTAPKSLSFVEG